MTVTSLDDLFQHELQETHMAERVILRALPMLALIGGTQTSILDSYATQARQRIERLEQIGKLGQGARAVTEPPIFGVLARIDDYIASINDRKALQSVAYSEFQAMRHYLLARYAMLWACANRLHKSEFAQEFDAALDEVRAALSQTPNVAGDRQERDQYKGISMGERLTAMFERKK